MSLYFYVKNTHSPMPRFSPSLLAFKGGPSAFFQHELRDSGFLAISQLLLSDLSRKE